MPRDRGPEGRAPEQTGRQRETVLECEEARPMPIARASSVIRLCSNGVLEPSIGCGMNDGTLLSCLGRKDAIGLTR